MVPTDMFRAMKKLNVNKLKNNCFSIEYGESLNIPENLSMHLALLTAGKGKTTLSIAHLGIM